MRHDIAPALNAVDGMLAREFGQASTLGVYLNELTVCNRIHRSVDEIDARRKV